MRFGPVPLDQAEGKILGHNIAGPDGRRAFKKGKPLTAGDVTALCHIGRKVVYVAELESDDVGENAAALRVAQVAWGGGFRISGPASGRVNSLVTTRGVLRVDAERLALINECDGITMATLSSHTVVQPRRLVATVKVIPFAVSESVIGRAETISAAGGPIIHLDELHACTVALILSGSPSARERIKSHFEPPLSIRLAALGSEIGVTSFVPLEGEEGEATLAETLTQQVSAGVDLIVLAGETAIMDRHDIAPRAVERAGGEVTCFGAPVDPGNLLMLAYLSDVPVLGAPGCVRSRKINVVDWVLPRLLVGDRLTRADLVALGHGGLLEEIMERPMPRNALAD